MARLIFLTGFMGSGKTETGRALAKRLRWAFADSDHAVEKSEGRGVHQIFAERGEKYFRGLERRAVRALSVKKNCVVALGGGALLDPASRALVEKNGVLVALTCAEPELWRRVKPVLKSRPLLSGPGGRARMRKLLSRRRAGYAAADVVVSTTKNGPAAAARLIARRLGL
jgi:shikimate kinase